ncbi:MAG: hypothetical protein RLZZ540_1185 [Bacteroidota bacterium]
MILSGRKKKIGFNLFSIKNELLIKQFAPTELKVINIYFYKRFTPSGVVFKSHRDFLLVAIFSISKVSSLGAGCFKVLLTNQIPLELIFLIVEKSIFIKQRKKSRFVTGTYRNFLFVDIDYFISHLFYF